MVIILAAALKRLNSKFCFKENCLPLLLYHSCQYRSNLSTFERQACLQKHLKHTFEPIHKELLVILLNVLHYYFFHFVLFLLLCVEFNTCISSFDKIVKAI